MSSSKIWRTQKFPERKLQATSRGTSWVRKDFLCSAVSSCRSSMYCQCQFFYYALSTWLSDQTIMEEASALQTSAVEGSRTTLDESVMPPPSSQRGLKRKSQDTEPALPVSSHVPTEVVSEVKANSHKTIPQLISTRTECPLTLTLSPLDGSFGSAATAAAATATAASTAATAAAGVQSL